MYQSASQIWGVGWGKAQGRSQDFSKGGHRQGHHPGIADYIWFIPLLSLIYQWAQSYYRGMKAHIN